MRKLPRTIRGLARSYVADQVSYDELRGAVLTNPEFARLAEDNVIMALMHAYQADRLYFR